MPAPSFEDWSLQQQAQGRSADPRQYEQQALWNYDFNNASSTGNMTARDAHGAILAGDKRRREEAAKKEAEAQALAVQARQNQYRDAYLAEQRRLQERFPSPVAPA